MKFPTALAFSITLLPPLALAICHDGWVGVGVHKICAACPDGKRAAVWSNDCTLVATSDGDENFCDAHHWPESTNVKCSSAERGSEVQGVQVKGKGYGYCKKSGSRGQNTCGQDEVEWCCRPL